MSAAETTEKLLVARLRDSAVLPYDGVIMRVRE
jgi:hypothetical protein